MVKVAFIVEGKTERKIIESDNFIKILRECNIDLLLPVINADGNGNMLPEKLKEDIEVLKSEGAQKIVILTDLDEDACITKTRQRIGEGTDSIIIIAVKQIEAWFLADSETLSQLMNDIFFFEFPEKEPSPFEKLRTLFLEKTKRGVGTKDILAARMLKYGFSLQRAAQHPNCPSATYFLNKLKHINQAPIPPEGASYIDSPPLGAGGLSL